jgi:3-hydroxyacyl-CoA dehydrogenase
LNGRIIIVGSGKMARNLGLYVASRGFAPSFVSRSPERLQALQDWARKRLRRFSSAGLGPETASFHLAGSTDLPAAELVIESVEEDRAAKQKALASLPAQLLEQSLVASNSSSILPSELHPQAFGLHFFYPVELTGFVEAVVPAGFPEAKRQRFTALCAELGLQALEQSEARAFGVNQLLLPLQNESALALEQGASPSDVEQASGFGLLGAGQLSLMDAVGLDVVLAAAMNYLGRMAPERARAFAPLTRVLVQLQGQGKRGAKNGDGLLCGSPLPYALPERPPLDRGVFRDAFLNAGLWALDEGRLLGTELELVLDQLLGASKSFAQALAAEDHAALARRLEDLFNRTGRWYFSPAASLAESRT